MLQKLNGRNSDLEKGGSVTRKHLSAVIQFTEAAFIQDVRERFSRQRKQAFQSPTGLAGPGRADAARAACWSRAERRVPRPLVQVRQRRPGSERPSDQHPRPPLPAVRLRPTPHTCREARMTRPPGRSAGERGRAGSLRAASPPHGQTQGPRSPSREAARFTRRRRGLPLQLSLRPDGDGAAVLRPCLSPQTPTRAGPAPQQPPAPRPC